MPTYKVTFREATGETREETVVAESHGEALAKAGPARAEESVEIREDEWGNAGSIDESSVAPRVRRPRRRLRRGAVESVAARAVLRRGAAGGASEVSRRRLARPRFSGLGRMPTARTVTNWLRRFTHATLRPLIQLNQPRRTNADLSVRDLPSFACRVSPLDCPSSSAVRCVENN